MEKERLYSGPIPKPFHKGRGALRSKLYKVPWKPADQRVSQCVRLYNETERIKKGQAIGGLANAKEQQGGRRTF